MINKVRQWMLLTKYTKPCYIGFIMITEAKDNNSQEVVEFLDISAVAEYLGVKEVTVYRYIKRHKRPLPSMKISRKKILVRKEDLDNWLEEARRGENND